MPSVLTLTALFVEGGRGRGGAYYKFQPSDGGLIREGDILEKGGLLERLR